MRAKNKLKFEIMGYIAAIFMAIWFVDSFPLAQYTTPIQQAVEQGEPIPIPDVTAASVIILTWISIAIAIGNGGLCMLFGALKVLAEFAKEQAKKLAEIVLHVIRLWYTVDNLYALLVLSLNNLSGLTQWPIASTATLFPHHNLPYKLFPLSCTQLE